MSLQIDIHSLRIGPRELLLGQRLQVAAGQILTLMGPSGCGKSCLLAGIAGLPVPGLQLQGQVLLNDQSVDALPTSQRRIGVLFQDDLLFAHMSVRENLLFAVPPGPALKRAAAADAALAELGFEALAARNPLTLSGGQRARVSLMRTLLAQPQALLLDEPFSKLDVQLRGQFRAWVFEHVRQHRLPTLLVTHDAADVADAAQVMHWPAGAAILTSAPASTGANEGLVYA